jgi:hypothetical protein
VGRAIWVDDGYPSLRGNRVGHSDRWRVQRRRVACGRADDAGGCTDDATSGARHDPRSHVCRRRAATAAPGAVEPICSGVGDDHGASGGRCDRSCATHAGFAWLFSTGCGAWSLCGARQAGRRVQVGVGPHSGRRCSIRRDGDRGPRNSYVVSGFAQADPNCRSGCAYVLRLRVLFESFPEAQHVVA